VVEIDWSTWDYRIYYSCGKPRRERIYRVSCDCGGDRWLRINDARKAVRKQSPCFSCSQARKAKLGFQAMVKRHGWRWAMRHVQAYRRQMIDEGKAPKSEDMVAALLDAMGFDYVREYALATKAHGRRKWVCLIDMMVVRGDQMWAVEVNGGCHKLPAKQRNDRRKRSLLTRRGIPMLTISDADLPDAQSMLSAFLPERSNHALHAFA
jgi:hypothetical protein